MAAARLDGVHQGPFISDVVFEHGEGGPDVHEAVSIAAPGRRQFEPSRHLGRSLPLLFARQTVVDLDCIHDPEALQSRLAMAKAAIEGLREPTAEMVRAGREAGFTSLLETAESDNDVPRDTWQAMIDAALGKDAQ